MNLFSKKVLYLALFMVVAVGFQSFAADLAGELQDARRVVGIAEREYAEREAAFDAAKNAVIDAKAGLDAAEASLADARTALEVARAAEAEVLARIEVAEAPSTVAPPTPPPAATGGGSTDTPAPPPATAGGGSTNTPPPATAGGGSTGTTADTRPPVPITPTDRGEIPDSIRRNEYYLESERYLALAQDAYNAGDYDTATRHAEEAARLARLSDEYIARQTGVLPATYTVREWGVHGDCFWNIAGQPWAYNDPHRWRVLYEANKSKLPNPNNPNIVEPGTVLDIPSIRGETRQGEWVSGRTYDPLR